jgi:hypothetical protein
MPSMPRSNDKPKKIAFNILGTPPNMRASKKGKKSKTEERMVTEDTFRSR